MPEKLPVFGFGGSNPSSPSAISATLSTMMPDAAFLFLPEISHGKKSHAGLRVVRSWVTSEYDEGDCTVVPDVVEVLAKRQADGHPVCLVLLYDNDSEEDQRMRYCAAEHGIEVRDLAQGMIALAEPEPPGEQLPAAGLSPEEIDQQQAPEALLSAVPPLPADEVKERRLQIIGEDDPQAELAFAFGMSLLRFMRSIVRAVLSEQENQVTGLVPGVQKPLTVVREEPAAEPSPAAEEPPAVPPEPSYDEGKVKYIHNPETDKYRRRKRGKLPGGWAEIMLTEREVSDLKAAGKVLES